MGQVKRFIVCGGRDYFDWIAVFHALNRLDARFSRVEGEGDDRVRVPGIAAIIQGGAEGADWCARDWAETYGVECITFAADWDRLGKAAGPTRNEKMLREARAHGLVAFPGGRGTFDMVARARHAGLMVWEPEK